MLSLDVDKGADLDLLDRSVGVETDDHPFRQGAGYDHPQRLRPAQVAVRLMWRQSAAPVVSVGHHAGDPVWLGAILRRMPLSRWTSPPSRGVS